MSVLAHPGRDGKVRVRLTSPRGETIVEGMYVSSEAVRFTTPPHEQHGPLTCDVAVAIGSSSWTVTPLRFQVILGELCSRSWVVWATADVVALVAWFNVSDLACPANCVVLQYFANTCMSACLAYGPGVLPKVCDLPAVFVNLCARKQKGCCSWEALPGRPMWFKTASSSKVSIALPPPSAPAGPLWPGDAIPAGGS